MKKQITSVSLSQNAKMMAALYLAMSVPMAAVFALFIANTGQSGQAVAALVIFPLVYGAVAYVGTLLGAWFYNLVAKRVGGFEFTTAEVSNG
jgi:hypothetical protein